MKYYPKIGTAIALGYFDGLHKGHRNVISAAEKKRTYPRLLYLSNPKSVLYGTQSNALMTNEDKINAWRPELSEPIRRILKNYEYACKGLCAEDSYCYAENEKLLRF